ncbi:MAG: sodium-translocating pyrophosphatase [Elusimicrobiota bacterium]
MELVYYVPAVGFLGFIAAIWTYFYVKSLPAGPQNAREIADEVQRGAFVFLKREYSIIAVFIVIVFAALWTLVGRDTSFAYLLGAAFSLGAGWFGMMAATKSSSRTLEGAKTGGAPLALDVAFKGGSVMGITVSAFGVIGVSGIYLLWGEPEIINGFAMGASSIALFARIGGGIYTKAADVGADIVGKTEANIPEDDPRNPGVIADNVGDNVGDTAGMGADLFESYVGSIIACLALAYTWRFDPSLGKEMSVTGMLLPLYLAAIGLISSLLGILSMRFLRSLEPDKALHGATYVAGIVFAAAAFFIIRAMFGTFGYFYCVVGGLVVGILIGEETNYYTSGPPIKKQADTAQSGSATGIISGIAFGFESVILPIITIVIGIGVAFKFGGLYGIALAALGMLATIGIVMATDSYGPIADNAGGLAEMSGAGADIRKITDKLDALGNSTAAVGKGFAIGSAALTALALFSAFQKTAAANGQVLLIQLTDVKVVMGLFLGVMMPCAIAAMTMKAVGRAANKMVHEIRRQFKEIPGLLEGKAKPDTGQCIDIVTKGALTEMILPGISAVLAPLIVGKVLGLNALGGFLAGATACGVVLGLMMANAGAIWDNAKKYIEAGHFGGKGSDTHKAAVVGDTVGDPFKDTSGPAMNILIKLMTIVSLVFLPALM